MDELRLIRPTAERRREIAEYRDEFPPERPRVTLDPERIPGLDHLENFERVEDWLRFCQGMAGKISWFMSVRRSDGRIVGFVCLRHRLEYDDDDEEFASHIGYSVRPSERGKGYGKAQLRLALGEAKALGLDALRIVCRDVNAASNRTILAVGGTYLDTIRGPESGLTVNRYDLRL